MLLRPRLKEWLVFEADHRKERTNAAFLKSGDQWEFHPKTTSASLCMLAPCHALWPLPSQYSQHQPMPPRRFFCSWFTFDMLKVMLQTPPSCCICLPVQDIRQVLFEPRGWKPLLEDWKGDGMGKGNSGKMCTLEESRVYSDYWASDFSCWDCFVKVP